MFKNALIISCTILAISKSVYAMEAGQPYTPTDYDRDSASLHEQIIADLKQKFLTASYCPVITDWIRHKGGGAAILAKAVVGYYERTPQQPKDLLEKQGTDPDALRAATHDPHNRQHQQLKGYVNGLEEVVLDTVRQHIIADLPNPNAPVKKHRKKRGRK